jgi:hypothetical protein
MRAAKQITNGTCVILHDTEGCFCEEFRGVMPQPLLGVKKLGTTRLALAPFSKILRDDTSHHANRLRIL